MVTIAFLSSQFFLAKKEETLLIHPRAKTLKHLRARNLMGTKSRTALTFWDLKRSLKMRPFLLEYYEGYQSKRTPKISKFWWLKEAAP